MSRIVARVLLRASSGPRIGLGHVMRSRAVAEEVRVLGGEALLVVDDRTSAGRLRAEGFEAVTPAERPEWTQLRASGAWVDGFVDWSEDLRALAGRGTPAFLVENRTSAREWASCVVYPALHHEPDAWDRAHAARVLAGAEWIPLSREVRAARTGVERDVDLLVTFGGSDPLRSTERVLAALPDGLRLAVSVGPHMEDRRAAITHAAQGSSVLEPDEPLAPWMARSRAAITALGTTLYELAFLGTPALILANYPADEPALGSYRERGPHRPLGLAGRIPEVELAERLARELPRLLAAPRPDVPGLGSGAERLAGRLLGGETSSLAA
jgi:spore coat polysaccharide biosynthesis predicted glycosyltransferase SpsG